MSISALLLGIYLVLAAIDYFKWAALSPILLGIFALAAGIAIFIEGLGVSVKR